ncbi:MAG: hypothetical protein VB858_17590, partial [Planctomycetaceae bacterium]
DEGKPDQKVVGTLARVRLMQGDYRNAARLYELGLEKRWTGKTWTPQVSQWMKGLAAAYVKLGTDEKLRSVLETVARYEEDNLPVRIKLARMALDRGDSESAKKWAREACFIDIMEVDVHRILQQVYEDAGEVQKSAREKRVIADIEAIESR